MKLSHLSQPFDKQTPFTFKNTKTLIHLFSKDYPEVQLNRPVIPHEIRHSEYDSINSHKIEIYIGLFSLRSFREAGKVPDQVRFELLW